MSNTDQYIVKVGSTIGGCSLDLAFLLEKWASETTSFIELP